MTIFDKDVRESLYLCMSAAANGAGQDSPSTGPVVSTPTYTSELFTQHYTNYSSWCVCMCICLVEIIFHVCLHQPAVEPKSMYKTLGIVNR